MFVLPAPVPITDEKMERYDEKMLEVNAAMKRLGELEDDWFQADLELRSEAVRPGYPCCPTTGAHVEYMAII